MLKLKLEEVSETIIDKFFAESSEEEREVMAFGLLALLSTFIGYSLIIIFSFLFGVTLFSLTAAISFSLLRIYSGGVHSSTFKGCILSSVISFVLIGLLADYLISIIGLEYSTIFFWFVFLLSSLIIYFYAPAQVEENLIKSELKRYKLRILFVYCIIHFTSFFI